MDISALQSAASYLGFGLFLLVCICCFRLMQKKNYVILIVWPILIYFCGPTLTVIFADAPVLGRYVFPKALLAETLMIFVYFMTLLAADKVFDISTIIKNSIESTTIRQLSKGAGFRVFFIITASVALFLQVKLLVDFGSVLSGSYVLDNVAEGLIPYWGFLAGLYEMIFFLFVLFLMGSDQKPIHRYLIVGVYCLTTLLRAGGGTRLVLIKEFAFLLILFYLKGNIKFRRLAALASVTLIVGSAIGFLRAQDISDVAFLGPVYGLVMESGLDALTLNIAYNVQESGFVSENGDFFQTLAFLALSAIPSFVRFGLTQADLDALSPYGLPISFGFDTPWPVGGMSGFGTLCYMTSYPIFASSILALFIGLVFRYWPVGDFKRIAIIVFSLNVIHFWRDPVDIAVKLVVQGIVCGIVLLVLARFTKQNYMNGRDLGISSAALSS